MAEFGFYDFEDTNGNFHGVDLGLQQIEQRAAFIHYYTKVNECPPAEADMQRYFRVTPPTVHQMVLALEARGLTNEHPATLGRSS